MSPSAAKNPLSESVPEGLLRGSDNPVLCQLYQVPLTRISAVQAVPELAVPNANITVPSYW